MSDIRGAAATCTQLSPANGAASASARATRKARLAKSGSAKSAPDLPDHLNLPVPVSHPPQLAPHLRQSLAGCRSQACGSVPVWYLPYIHFKVQRPVSPERPTARIPTLCLIAASSPNQVSTVYGHVYGPADHEYQIERVAISIT